MKKLIKRLIKYGPIVYPVIKKFMDKRRKNRYER